MVLKSAEEGEEAEALGVLLNVAEVIALDTEYHDPEEVHACAPRHFQPSSPQLPALPPELPSNRAGTAVIHSDEEVASISASRPQVWCWWCSCQFNPFL